MTIENKLGRWFTENQLLAEERQKALNLPASQQSAVGLFCTRCATLFTESLPDGHLYCRSCIVFGRVMSNEMLYYFPQKNFSKGINYLHWKGRLTEYQLEISEALRSGIREGQSLLIHAVTGAGKTEMMYQAIADVLYEGKTIAIVSPRVDVCLELYHRISRDFTCPISLLHGNSEPYQRCQLVIATTHQLLKFYQAFDVILIDEVDAFPFVDNKMLYHAVSNSLKKKGVQIFLTATSTDELDKKVRQRTLKKLSLARRFHNSPLVVPRFNWLSNWDKSLKKSRLSNGFKQQFEHQRKSKYPLLIFYPTIIEGQQVCQMLKECYPNEKIGFVASNATDRLEQVDSFRTGQLDVLVTTSILERGVTFPKVDVFVLKANHPLFSSSSLVQISGRVGRSSDRPTGELIFFHDGLTKNMKKAKHAIIQMNYQGGF